MPDFVVARTVSPALHASNIGPGCMCIHMMPELVLIVVCHKTIVLHALPRQEGGITQPYKECAALSTSGLISFKATQSSEFELYLQAAEEMAARQQAQQRAAQNPFFGAFDRAQTRQQGTPRAGRAASAGGKSDGPVIDVEYTTVDD